MSKQLTTIYGSPPFTPGNSNAGTLDFTLWRNFSLSKLYAVINVTRSTPIYIAGTPGFGANTSATVGNLITLTSNTVSYSSTDVLNVYYDTASGFEQNSPLESGGNLQLHTELLSQILTELRLHTQIFADGFRNIIREDDIEAMRNDINNPNTQQPNI